MFEIRIHKNIHKNTSPQVPNASKQYRMRKPNSDSWHNQPWVSEALLFFPREGETSLGKNYTSVQFSNELGPSYQKSTYTIQSGCMCANLCLSLSSFAYVWRAGRLDAKTSCH